MCKLGVISQERWKIEVKLLLSANRKSSTPRRLAQQQMTLSEFLKSTSSASRVISAVAELLVGISVPDSYCQPVCSGGETAEQRTPLVAPN